MTAENVAHGALRLEPLPYHESIRDYLKANEPEVWQWYASQQTRNDRAEDVRFDLLKSTYRVDRESQESLYATAEHVARTLSLDVPITIYQAQSPLGPNASLAYLPGEAHVVLHGDVAAALTEPELQALLAHELSHLLLWQGWDGELLIVDQVLSAMTHDAVADTPHFQTARLFGLYNEIFCDRGSLYVVGDPLTVVSMLVKVHTGLTDVNAESYLRQAEEIYSKGSTATAEVTHPEAFIRARALKIWHDGDADATAKIASMIAGPPSFSELDLLGQQQVAALTRRMIDVLLAHDWFRSDPVLSHARLFFDDYAVPVPAHQDPALAAEIKTDDPPLQDYYCYVLMDFVAADRDLEELPLAAALTLAETLGIKDRLSELARKELRLRKKQLDKIDQTKTELLAAATK